MSSANANLLALEDRQRRGETHPQAVHELFRSLHTLKGLSAMIGAEPIVDIAHEMETLLRASDRAGGRLPAAAVDVMLRGLRAIEERVALIAKDAVLPAAPRDLVDALAALRVDGAAAPSPLAIDGELLKKLTAAEHEQLARAIAAGRRVVRVEFAPSLERSARGQNITTVRERVGVLGEIVKVIPRSVAAQKDSPASVAFTLIVISDATDDVLAEAAGTLPSAVSSIVSTDAPAPAQAAVAPLAGELGAADDGGDGHDMPRSNVVRVDVARLDDALEHLSALVVTRARLERVAQDLARGTGSVRDLLQVVGESGKRIRDLRASIMRARMVSVRDVLERAPLIVRGLSKSSGKEVRLTLDVGDSKLDKAVADRLFPIVIHLLRNAVDHALESAHERSAAGKPPEGTIHIICRGRSDNQLELIVQDDGAGVDRVKVAARAGVPVPEDDDDLLALVTRPGLSTRDEVTQTSGRGIGMDIVRRVVVDDLGGQLRMWTEAGKGTRFTLIVPLSVTILDVFTFRCGGRMFVVPVSAVDDFAAIDASLVHRAPGAGDDRTARLFAHRGSTIPLFRLSTLLRLPNAPLESGGIEALGTKAMVVRRNDEVFGFEVDKLVGQQEVVVRPLQDPLVRLAGIAGSTDLGDGQATLVLDLYAIARSASNNNAANSSTISARAGATS